MPKNPVRPTVEYAVAAPDPRTHHFAVSVRVAGFAADAVEFALPVWTPGSYMVRDFSRHVFACEARDDAGRRLPWRKVRKNAWQVEHRGLACTFSFQVFAFDPTVRTAFLDADRGWFNGANLLPYVVGAKDLPATVEVTPPPGFAVETTMPRANGRARRYRAADYDRLCDHPFVLGRLRVRRFRAAGKAHRFVLNGDGDLPERTVADVARGIEAAAKLFGGLPYREYAFFVNFGTDAEGMGGLEHADCSVLHVPGRATLDPVKYRAFLGLVAHEHFHLWNVKRIRDRRLGPFDYEQEVYTDLLWFHEGFTSYYDDLLPARAGVFSADEYLGLLSETLGGFYATPGRRVQSLAEASFDAWIKFYKKNEETRSTTVSYYAHGSLVALLADVRIRVASRGRRSLDDVLRVLARDAEQGGVLDAERWLALAREATGVDLSELYRDHVAGVREPDFTAALRALGLEAVPARPAELERPWLGAVTRVEAGRVIVEEALHGGPALRGGLQARDELVAVDGRRVGADLEAALRGVRLGRNVVLDVFRQDRLRRLTVRPTKNPAPPLKIVPRKGATAVERRRFSAWCGRQFPDLG
jgi:predicted metalloprotease with PDZ domain